MKIAFFVNTFPTLSQTFILSQIVSLIKAGHEVDIFARKMGGQEISHPCMREQNLEERTYYYGWYLERSNKNRTNRYLYLIVNLIKALSSHPMMLSKFLKVGRFGKKIESFNKFNDVLVFLHGGRLNYDIVHCHFGPQGNLAALLKAIGLLQGKIVTTFHGYDMSKYIKRKGADVYELLFKGGDMFLPVSERWKNELIGLGCDENKISVHRMGVEFDRISFEKQKTRDRAVNLLTVARLVEKKGIVYGIKAVSEVLKKHPHLKYRIAGDGPLRLSLERLVGDLGIGENVELLGWKNQEEIFSLLNETDIFMAPSVTDERGDQEGVPVTLMEAMAHGIPVLSTWHSGIPELVQDGKSGYLVAERDVGSLAEKIAYLVEHPERRSEMGELGRDFVINNYNNNKLNARLIEIYESMLGGDLAIPQEVPPGPV